MLLRKHTSRGRKKPNARARARRFRAERLGTSNPLNFALSGMLSSQTCGNREADAGLLGQLDGADRPANHSEA